MLTCALCGRTPLTGVLRTLTGDIFCLSHRDLPRCQFCAAPIGVPEEPLCPPCRATAVLHQDDVKATLPAIRARLHTMGIKLAMPVRVALVTPRTMSTLAGHSTGTVAGVTQSRGQQVLSISVVTGLPVVEFGSVVAHECMHAWMAQQGYPSIPDQIAEGLCQLASYGWLRDQPGPIARMLQRQIEAEPDPVYGDGFRLVRDAVQRHGLRAVLTTLQRTGRLPQGASTGRSGAP